MASKINPVKVKQDADKLEKAGRIDQAIDLYKQLVDDNPRDWNTINKIGDLYARLQKNREASEQYAKVADFYAKDGFLLKAIAIWKKIDKLDATALEPKVNLGELYAKQGLMMEAKGQYQVVVDEYVKRGRSRDAADVLRKMVEIDPSDLKTRSKLADLYTREGSTAKAVEEYVAIADELNKKGHLAEGLQVLEKGLKLDPKSQRLREELARIHLVQKNYDKAAHFLEEAARSAPQDASILSRLGEAYLGARKIEEAEAIFRRLLELNPKDNDARLQMGRVHVMQGHLDKAFDELGPVIDGLVEKREHDRAASILQQLVQKNPGHIKSLVKLVEVHRQAKNDRAVAQAYSQLAEAYIQKGELEQATSVLEILVGMEPQSQQYQSKLQFVKDKQARTAPSSAPPPPAPAARAATPVASAAPMVEEFDVSLDEHTAPVSAPRAGGSIQPSGPLGPEDREFVEEHLAEGRVFRKYGLIDKAVEQFESVVARFPDNADARKELRDVYEEKGQAQQAGEQALALIEIAKLSGDAALAEENLEYLKNVAPDLVPVEAPPAPMEEEVVGDLGTGEEELALGVAVEEDLPLSLDEEPVAPAPAPKPAPAPPEEEVEIPFDAGEGLDLGASAEPTFGEELPTFAAPEPEPATLDEELPALGEELPAIGEELPALGEELPAFGEELPALGEELPALGEELPALGEELPAFGEELPAVGEEPPAADAGLDLGAFAAPPEEPGLDLGELAAPAAPAVPAVPEALARRISEAEEFLSLGFVDDAREALRQASGRFPDHPALLACIAQLGIDLQAPVAAPPAFEDLAPPEPEDAFAGLGLAEPEPPAPEPPPADEGMIDLGAELSGLFGAQSAVEPEPPPAADSGTDLGDAGLSEIFREFRKGVDKQLGKEDYDTRYNLGIAYKEMGLIDEAIAEFQLAAKDETRLLECSSMLGICFLEKGMPKLAVKWFDKGLAVPGRSPEEYQGLRYDLATAYEADGDNARALALFTELFGQDATFRDVAAKVRELGG
ncbi:MAG: tetratricopeptide repeat protein [Vicinamibacteria bacterium]|nr:tetratricopeptide repeat protein [Vicinamibacteria bacterium]